MLCRFLLALPQQFRPQVVGWDSADQCTKNFKPTETLFENVVMDETDNSPSVLLLICVSEKEDIQIPLEAETE